MNPNSTLRSATHRFYSRAQLRKGAHCTIPLLGLPGAGKTTLLRRLQTGQLERTHLCAQLCLETAMVQLAQNPPASDGTKIRMPSWDVIGPEGRISPAVQFRITRTPECDALIWAVNSTDRAQFEASANELRQLLACPILSNAGIPILILATRQHMPDAATPGEIQTAFAPVLEGRQVFVVGATPHQSLASSALYNAFRWLLDSIRNTKEGKPPPRPPSPPGAVEPEMELDKWLERAKDDCTTQRLLQQFQTVSFPAWDHHTRIRVMYSVLTAFGREQGRDLLMREMQMQASAGERPLHITMTRFWMGIVYFGISSMRPAPEPIPGLAPVSVMFDEEHIDSESTVSEPGSEWTLSESENLEDDVQHVRKDDGGYSGSKTEAGFIQFLLLNPFIVNEELWMECYSKEVMMSGEAQTKMVFPDKRRFPDVIGRAVCVK